MRHDVCHPLFVEVDPIFNLACPASPIHYQHDPVQTTKVSVIGSINMLGLAKRVKVPILQASTSEVYGDRSEEHTSELQSLMRISYAVFCLKKKKKNNTSRSQ